MTMTTSNSHARSSPLSARHSLRQTSHQSPKRPFMDDQTSQYPTRADKCDDGEFEQRNFAPRHTIGPPNSEHLSTTKTLEPTRVATLRRTMNARKAFDRQQPPRDTSVKVTLPSFRESFPFALSGMDDEPSVQSTMGTRYRNSFPPALSHPPAGSLPKPWINATESRFTFRAQLELDTCFKSSYDARSRPLMLDHGHTWNSVHCVTLKELVTDSVSSDSSSGYETDYTLPTSCAASECSYKGIIPPANRSRRLPSNPYGPHSSPYPVVGQLSVSSTPPMSPRQIAHERYSLPPVDRVPVAKKARIILNPTHSNINAPSPPATSPLSSAFRRSPPTVPSPPAPATHWPQVSRVSPGTISRSRRPPPSDAPRQEWEDYAARLESPRDHYQCLWSEDDLECYYHAKKQAMKRHVELTHLKYRPHKCHLCENSYGQRTSLKVHLATHTGDKDYVCPEEGCPKEYSDASRLLRHRVRTHGYIVRETAPKLRYRPRLNTVLPSSKRRNSLTGRANQPVKKRRHSKVYSA
ncbi:hypothetical protein FPV67DRAFT_1476057 [Lyophyllum atratum]|nr:hypothetical protein FPV67DRAFT_1476057 [Lyophyllum atratum]